MDLNSSSDMSKFTFWNCGESWYLEKAICQSCSFSGGMAPMITFHSVMDKPEPVSRVMPPMTTIAKISTQPVNNQVATARLFSLSFIILSRDEESRFFFYP